MIITTESGTIHKIEDSTSTTVSSGTRNLSHDESETEPGIVKRRRLMEPAVDEGDWLLQDGQAGGDID